MLAKILKKDFKRNKAITIILFVFIMLSVLLASSGTTMITQLFRSINHLFTVSSAPHYVQMHAGPVDRAAIQSFAAKNSLIKSEQISEMLVIDNANLFFGDNQEADSSSVMDNGFVVQNKSFDYLLTLENKRIEVLDGEIAVPIYYRQQHHLNLGDPIRISVGSQNMTFTITDFVRDVQMNPSIISSKRFVVSEADHVALKSMTGETEYMIAFQLNDLSKLNEFKTAYQTAGLPAKGPAIDYSLFQMLHALTDGVVAVIIFLVSSLLILIAVLCLRFTILTTLEEDYKEIGVMKAFGIRQQHIRNIYLTKYIVLAGGASLFGYVVSLCIRPLFLSNMALYIGIAPQSILQSLIPILVAGLVFALVLLFCSLVLRRFHKISAVEALRAGAMGELKVNTKRLPLYKSRIPSVNVFLALKDVVGRFKMYLLLFIIFVICFFIIIVPVNFLHTMQSPSFVAYMGVGQSDMRMDLQQSDHMQDRFDEVQHYLAQDTDIVKFSPLVTSKYSVVGSEGALESIQVETGDFSIFPLKYSSGNAPINKNDMALSSLNADALSKKVGDALILVINGKQHEMTVSGIYQDVTNGGKTAKALLPYQPEDVLWYTLNADIRHGSDIGAKITEYTGLFPGVKVTHLEDYMHQTLGSTIKQIKMVTVLAVIIAVFISILITSLFLKLLTAKDYSGIAIMRSLGIAAAYIRKQYVIRILVVLAGGILMGMLMAHTFGQSLVGLLMSSMGASNIQFVTNPWVSYFLYPLALGLVVTIATLVGTLSMKKYSMTRMITE